MIRSATIYLAVLFFSSCVPQSPRNDAISNEEQQDAAIADQKIDPLDVACETKEFVIGDVNVDFSNGHANISGSLTGMACVNDVDRLSEQDLQTLRTEYEDVIRYYYIGVVLSCARDHEWPPHIVAIHDDALKRMNGALGQEILIDFECSLGFSESLL
jgi:hypothetical protein